MKGILVAGILALSIMSAFAVFSSIQQKAKTSTAIIARFQEWRAKHQKLYATPAESEFRLATFSKTIDQIEEISTRYNANLLKMSLPLPQSQMFDINETADLTDAEFERMFTGEAQGEQDESVHVSDLSAWGPASLQQSGYKPFVKNQGSCGSCWSFSAIQQVEKYVFDRERTQIELSEQDLVDCDTGNNGCNGGSSISAINWIKSNGISRASQYPYKQAKGTCSRPLKANRLDFAYDSNFGSFTTTFSVANARTLTGKGAVLGVSLHASKAFRYLKAGSEKFNAPASDSCFDQTNHAINIVSADSNSVRIQNSWGSSWCNSGTKDIIPCGSSLMGTGNTSLRFSHSSMR